MKKLPIIALPIIIAAIILFLVFQENESDDIIVDKTIQTITLGTIHRDAAKMTDRLQPIADHIAENLSNEDVTYIGAVMIPNTQEKMIEYINNGDVDIYFDSPIIGMKINQEAKMSPVLLGWKENVPSYHSVFITSQESEITSLENLEGKTIIFEDSESTSGYFLPKYHLEMMGYVVGNESSEQISYMFSLDDENTPIWILEEKGDFGTLSNIDFEDIPTNAKNKLKIIGGTKDIPRQIVFFRDDLDVEAELLDIFLQMNTDTVPEILDSAKTAKYSKLDPKDLSQVKNILESLNFE